ncbi:hypothetical protein NC651_006276 [Populus alba x Populus x berolinensis]|nr:hypothetical protein NC651_006276 [Populus alba x Populus x berolinensis]
MACFVNANSAPQQFYKIQVNTSPIEDSESELALSKQTCRNRKQIIQFNRCNVLSIRVTGNSVNSLRKACITQVT